MNEDVLGASPQGGFQSVHFAEEPPQRAPLEAEGVRVADLAGDAVHGKQALMAALADALELPDYFGGNWDALDEVLRDLSWLESEGTVLVVNEGSDLWNREPALAGTLVSVWTSAARDWAVKGLPFHLVFVR